MLVHIHLIQFQFSYGLVSSRSLTLPGSVSRSRPALTKTAKCPESLCLRGHYPSFLAPTDSCASPIASLLLRLLTSSMGLCRLSPVPAGYWTFPVLSPQFFPWVSGPLPRWASMVLSPVPSHGNIGLLQPLTGSTFPQLSRKATSRGASFSGLQSFRYVQTPTFARHPGRSYPSLLLSSCDFYIRASHDSLPHHAPDMLNARIGQLTFGDLHPTRSVAFLAALIQFNIKVHLLSTQDQSGLPRFKATTRSHAYNPNTTCP
jgi:hypothetical protein